ncbi:hypothetical protein [Dyella sp. Tek66A03]|uniref:hypothetical protein n=1 Tax=Dyella sp. Tek66A03 TaxID=3458298 RepID=UPI00403ECFC5
MNSLAFRCLAGCALLAVGQTYAAVPGSQFTSFAGFELGTLTLSQVAEKLGAAKLVEVGDGGEYEASICYRTPFGLIYFLSGEMGRSEHDLLGFGLGESDSTRAKSCASWPSSRAVPDLSLGGINLGMSKAAFASAVRANVRWENEIAYVAFEGKRLMTQSEVTSPPKEVRQGIRRGETQSYFDVDVSLMATFQDGRLTELHSWKIESQ